MPKNIQDIFDKRGQRYLRAFVINMAVIGLFGGLGYFLDLYLNTKPIAFILLLIISFPVSIIIQIYFIKKM